MALYPMAGNKDFVLHNDPSANDLTRHNHYVPQWYQRGFLQSSDHLHCLNLYPNQKKLPNGRVITYNERELLPPSKCFSERDLYTTFFGPFISDIIERKMFGEIDDKGARAVRAFIEDDLRERHERFMEFFYYIDAQKTRTPKGLTWLKARYGSLGQTQLMSELQVVQRMHCTMWFEGVREIVSAKKAKTKFIISDHPVTVYNYDCPPESEYCQYPNDPAIAWKASQTIFALDRDHCLILTNYEYASEPELADSKAKRTNARNFGETMVRTNAFIRERELDDRQVQEINFVLKKRARKYIAAAQKEWLYPEKDQSITWESVKATLLPPSNKIYEFGGEMVMGFSDGTTLFQDAFGRTTHEADFLKKEPPKTEPGPNDYCPCGRGRKYKKCCRGLQPSQRRAWNMLSIRERNIIFYNGINDILGISKGKIWDDVRQELSDEQVKEIHELFAVLWPPHTDIVSLLSKPDGHLRAVYSGIVDIRRIPFYATSATLYFDEVIIQNPFMHADGLKLEYNPIKNPGSFKEITLKQVALFFSLYPYIFDGTVNFIPNLGVFNRHLQLQLLDIGKQKRHDDLDFDEAEKKVIEDLLKEDFERTFWALPREQFGIQMKESNPDIGEELIDSTYAYIQKKRWDDPLTLLQDGLYANGGQYNFHHMTPGFEMSLFLGQVTGAVVFTDSPTRWQELTAAQDQKNYPLKNRWTELIENIQGIRFPFNIDFEAPNELRRAGKFGNLRKAWQDIYETIKREDVSDTARLTALLTKNLVAAVNFAQKEIISAKLPICLKDSTMYTFDAKFQCLIPEGGITHNHVLRLLNTSGIENYLKSVPVVIFASQQAVDHAGDA